MQLARRNQAIQPFYVVEVLNQVVALEAQGRDVIRLFVGEPDFKVSAAITSAAQASLANQHQGYISSVGLAELRERIADRYARWHGVALNPERVIVTPGGSAALQMAFLATVNAGDEVLLPEPGYPCNANLLHMMDANPVRVMLDPSQGMALSIDRLSAAITERTKALLIASPSNPLGNTQSLAQWQQLRAFCDRHNLALIADEIYHGLTFNESAPTVLQADDDAWVVQSFSKFYGMTGWRLGWLVVPESAINLCQRIAQNLYLSASSIAQYAALSCFEPEVEAACFANRDELMRRRDFLMAALPEIGLPIMAQPDGAFYLYLDVSEYTQDALRWCARLLQETGVALTPGIDFGGLVADTTVRLAYTVDEYRLAEAVERIKLFISNQD